MFAVLLIETEGELPHESVVLSTVFVTVGLLVLAHGLSAAPLVGRYGAWFAAHPNAETLHVEAGEAAEIHWRGRGR